MCVAGGKGASPVGNDRDGAFSELGTFSDELLVIPALGVESDRSVRPRGVCGICATSAGRTVNDGFDVSCADAALLCEDIRESAPADDRMHEEDDDLTPPCVKKSRSLHASSGFSSMSSTSETIRDVCLDEDVSTLSWPSGMLLGARFASRMASSKSSGGRCRIMSMTNSTPNAELASTMAASRT